MHGPEQRKTFGNTPRVVEMRSEPLLSLPCMVLYNCALSTSFTSKGLLMIPTLLKLAGRRRRLSPCCGVPLPSLFWRSFRRYGGAPGGIARCWLRQASGSLLLISHIATEKPRAIYSISLMVPARLTKSTVSLADDVLELMPQAKFVTPSRPNSAEHPVIAVRPPILTPSSHDHQPHGTTQSDHVERAMISLRRVISISRLSITGIRKAERVIILMEQLLAHVKKWLVIADPWRKVSVLKVRLPPFSAKHLQACRTLFG